MVSIHPLICPLNSQDSERKQNLVHYQTMSKIGALTITNKDFPKGFFIKLTTHASNCSCALGMN